jgi:hypothetical protein
VTRRGLTCMNQKPGLHALHGRWLPGLPDVGELTTRSGFRGAPYPPGSDRQGQVGCRGGACTGWQQPVCARPLGVQVPFVLACEGKHRPTEAATGPMVSSSCPALPCAGTDVIADHTPYDGTAAPVAAAVLWVAFISRATFFHHQTCMVARLCC